MLAAALRHPTIDAALSCAATLTGMELVFISSIDETKSTFQRLRGELPGLAEGMSGDRTTSFCHRLIGGAPASTSDAGRDPHYANVPIRATLGIRSYVGVVIRDSRGRAIGTLCGLDRRSVPVGADRIAVMQELAHIVAAQLEVAPAEDGVVIRRTPDGWAVGSGRDDSLLAAMSLADLLADELAPPDRPPRQEQVLDEIGKLRLAVSQLEHALAARVTVEQAIGVLTERLRTPPREAFETLRRVARRGGTKVHDVARDVVASATDPAVSLPPELQGPL